MSNNKQSMKLYTEEQLKKAIKDAFLSGVERHNDYTLIEKAILIDLTPIELPSESIEELVNNNASKSKFYDKIIFEDGAIFEIQSFSNKQQGDNK